MNRKWTIIISIALCGVFGAQANLLLNGNFSSSSYATGGNHLNLIDVNHGWAVKSQVGIVINGTNATWMGTTDTLIQDALAQVVSSDGSVSGSALLFDFDWIASSGNTTPNLNYQVVGWTFLDGYSAADVASGVLLKNINGSSANVGNFLNGDGTAVTTYQEFTGGVASFTGTAGANISPTPAISFDLSGLGDGFDDVADYAYFGVRLWVDASGDASPAIGSSVDNISLIPEPATIGILGLGAMIALLVRRVRYATTSDS